jgi:hypothetical protein
MARPTQTHADRGTKVRVVKGGRLAWLIVAMIAGAGCASSSSNTGPPPSTTTTSTPEAAQTAADLTSVNQISAQLSQAIEAPSADLQAKFNDAAEILTEINQQKASVYQTYETGTQHTNAVCAQYGYASSQCSQALQQSTQDLEAAGAPTDLAALDQRTISDLTSVDSDSAWV